MTRMRTPIGALALAAALIIAAPAPALAHDDLVSSTPADGADLAAGPTEIALTFTAEVLEMGALVVVADAADHDWTTGAPVVEGTTVSVPVDEALPDAGYEVRWRVVSSDGHPISGVIPFTVGGAEPLARVRASDDAAAAEPTPDTTEAGAADDGASVDAAVPGILRPILIGAGGALAALGVLALVTLVRRRPSVGGRGAGT